MGLDAVVVASPPNVHREQVQAAIASGAHVLCEKPFAITAEDAWAMTDAARAAGRHLLVAFGWNFMPLMTAARVGDGGAGHRAHRVREHRHQRRGARAAAPRHALQLRGRRRGAPGGDVRGSGHLAAAARRP